MRWLLVIAFLIPAIAHAELLSSGQIVVVDGDTIDVEGERYRMIGYDTPEKATPRRAVGPNERALAERASKRLDEILESGQIDLREVRCSCPEDKIGTRFCNGGRKCAILSVDSKNVGDTLIAEGLARKFKCYKTSCAKLPDWPKITGDR